MPGSFDNIDDVLAAADLFVLPSYEEGMSLSLLEAMAAGLPVIATDIPGNRKLIEHERHGLLVPDHNTEALAEGICRLLSNQHESTLFTEAAYQLVKQHYSVENMANIHFELFQQLLNKSHPGAR